jgi:hypothetical protein
VPFGRAALGKMRCSAPPGAFVGQGRADPRNASINDVRVAVFR